MMCAMFIILVAFASVKMAFDSVPLALFSRASGLIGTEYTNAFDMHLIHFHVCIPTFSNFFSCVILVFLVRTIRVFLIGMICVFHVKTIRVF